MESGFQKVQKENFFGSGSLCSKGRGSVTHLAASTIPRVGEKKQEAHSHQGVLSGRGAALDPTNCL